MALSLLEEAEKLREAHGDTRVSIVDAAGIVRDTTVRAWAAKRLPLLLAHGVTETTVRVALSEADRETEGDLRWLVAVCERAVRRAAREAKR